MSEFGAGKRSVVCALRCPFKWNRRRRGGAELLNPGAELSGCALHAVLRSSSGPIAASPPVGTYRSGSSALLPPRGGGRSAVRSGAAPHRDPPARRCKWRSRDVTRRSRAAPRPPALRGAVPLSASRPRGYVGAAAALLGSGEEGRPAGGAGPGRGGGQDAEPPAGAAQGGGDAAAGEGGAARAAHPAQGRWYRAGGRRSPGAERGGPSSAARWSAGVRGAVPRPSDGCAAAASPRCHERTPSAGSGSSLRERPAVTARPSWRSLLAGGGARAAVHDPLPRGGRGRRPGRGGPPAGEAPRRVGTGTALRVSHPCSAAPGVGNGCRVSARLRCAVCGSREALCRMPLNGGWGCGYSRNLQLNCLKVFHGALLLIASMGSWGRRLQCCHL